MLFEFIAVGVFQGAAFASDRTGSESRATIRYNRVGVADTSHNQRWKWSVSEDRFPIAVGLEPSRVDDLDGFSIFLRLCDQVGCSVTKSIQ